MDLVSPEPMSGCWLWTGAVMKSGYGCFGLDGKTEKAHRAAWRIFRGPIPAGLVVRHKCDLPGCVNPSHLEIGTNADNVADKMKRGRARSGVTLGEKNNKAKLTAEQAREVFLLATCGAALNLSEIGRRYGIAGASVAKIRDGINWAHATVDLRTTRGASESRVATAAQQPNAEGVR